MGDAHLIADDAVIARAKEMDRDALGELWRIYQPQVLRFLRTKRTAAAVDDIASQVWIDVGRAIGGFVGDGRQFQRWIFTIAHRRSLDEGRRTGRRREVLIDSQDHETTNPRTARSVDGGEAAVDGAVEAAVEMMATLPPQMAEAVMLRVVYELSVEETAELLSTTTANVRVLTHRGLGKLRVRLDRARSAEGQPDSATVLPVLHDASDSVLVRNV